MDGWVRTVKLVAFPKLFQLSDWERDVCRQKGLPCLCVPAVGYFLHAWAVSPELPDCSAALAGRRGVERGRAQGTDGVCD